MIKLVNVNKYFGNLHVLKDVNLEVKEGEKLVIIGPSGSGKSTTVRCMNFLEEPSSGEVYIDGEFAKMLMFEDFVDVSRYADGKAHTVKLIVYASNRNIYGPHHLFLGEPMSVSPYSFDFTGAWREDYTCPDYRERYAFVKFSII